MPRRQASLTEQRRAELRRQLGWVPGWVMLSWTCHSALMSPGVTLTSEGCSLDQRGVQAGIRGSVSVLQTEAVTVRTWRSPGNSQSKPIKEVETSTRAFRTCTTRSSRTLSRRRLGDTVHLTWSGCWMLPTSACLCLINAQAPPLSPPRRVG